MQPLRIAEPRYRDLLLDALSGDRLVAMAVLAPGWESDYEGRPRLCPVACLARVVASQELDHGTYNVLISGIARVRLVRELPPTRTFREAEVAVLADHYPPDETERIALRERLRNALLEALPDLVQSPGQLGPFLGDHVPLGHLTDVLGYLLEVGPAAKEALLAEPNVHRRALVLLEHLAALAEAGPGRGPVLTFPPGFSAN
jgi:Lon protease-like protein